MRPSAKHMILGSAFLAVTLATGAADAQPRRRYYAPADDGIVQPPLTVNKRSFLEF